MIRKTVYLPEVTLNGLKAALPTSGFASLNEYLRALVEIELRRLASIEAAWRAPE